jgi:penicillin-insensitive murein DD-endopeptidase
MRSVTGPALVALVGALAGACTTVSAVTDGTSLSYGFTNNGQLVNASLLPRRGEGYLIPDLWATRGLNYATDEMVGLLVRAARRVHADDPGHLIYIADMSPQRGGPSAWHRSHQTGRDADVLFFAVTAQGKPAGPTPGMFPFDQYGATKPIPGMGVLYFDIERNWRMVRALVEDPSSDVQFLFVARYLRDMMLDWARSTGEPAEAIARAEAMLVQPGDSAPHHDHLHVRIFCPASDRALGCRERGPLRWFKKSYKYLAERGLTVDLGVHQMVARPFCHVPGGPTSAPLYVGIPK